MDDGPCGAARGRLSARGSLVTLAGKFVKGGERRNGERRDGERRNEGWLACRDIDIVAGDFAGARPTGGAAAASDDLLRDQRTDRQWRQSRRACGRGRALPEARDRGRRG